jgi:hypothetical protein
VKMCERGWGSNITSGGRVSGAPYVNPCSCTTGQVTIGTRA